MTFFRISPGQGGKVGRGGGGRGGGGGGWEGGGGVAQRHSDERGGQRQGGGGEETVWGGDRDLALVFGLFQKGLLQVLVRAFTDSTDSSLLPLRRSISRSLLILFAAGTCHDSRHS
jgi:hypothetical protein